MSKDTLEKIQSDYNMVVAKLSLSCLSFVNT